MLREITVGVDFICSLLNGKVPEAPLAEFKARLALALQQRFAGHWNPERPCCGSAFRCILTTADKVDPVLRAAVEGGAGGSSAVDGSSVSGAASATALLAKIAASLPPYLMVWIDPNEVSYRIGAQGSVCHLSLDGEGARKKSLQQQQQQQQQQQRRSPPLSASTKPFVPKAQQASCGAGVEHGSYTSQRLVDAVQL